jgi:hypothetical protein
MWTSCEYNGHFEILADDKIIAFVTKDDKTYFKK